MKHVRALLAGACMTGGLMLVTGAVGWKPVVASGLILLAVDLWRSH